MKHIYVSLCLLMLTACAKTPDWDYDKSANFSNVKSFAWLPNASLTKDTTHYQISPLMEQRVQKAVNATLTTQGLQQVAIEQADVLINYHASVDSKIEIDTFTTGYNARWDNWGFGIQNQTHTQNYEVGTLVIDVIDRGTNQLIWRGAKEGRLKKNQTPEQRTLAIEKTVATILANFPPK
ncbi:DUF4136 domain-containing protein [Pseudoalteromonas tunicata]|nr:DUF4136 domain-containing protein [Pseudoalteromonas tunicata]ATC95243.1 hypothetical protein PTUN_a2821 [Pseudoalteromonas tunicata]AXT30848.1 DUF4136 domain-containing protein [Pseudoalteromonas tunicata]MDP4982361.1 DUF4136 domain-containing protein [Pseudoalteromonas tunicata]MDP5213162.1 DUF4136 domain-containing protein [Pseudoalteromonas tunicata]